MIEYKYQGYILEMRLLEDKESIKIRGTVSSHPNITFTDNYLPGLKKQFHTWADNMLEEVQPKPHIFKYKGVELEVVLDKEEGCYIGELESKYDGESGGEEFRGRTIEHIKEEFEQYVWDLYVSYLKFQDLRCIEVEEIND